MDHNDYLKAKVEATSGHNDGWTRQFYQEIVDNYEKHKDNKEGDKCKESSETA